MGKNNAHTLLRVCLVIGLCYIQSILYEHQNTIPYRNEFTGLVNWLCSVFIGFNVHFLYRIRYALFLICLATLLYGILRPESPPQLFTQSDKYLHFVAFLGFSLATRFAFCHKAIWAVWIALVMSAPGLEFLQHYLQASRQFSWGDVAGNLSGVIAAFIIWKLFHKRLFINKN